MLTLMNGIPVPMLVVEVGIVGLLPLIVLLPPPTLLTVDVDVVVLIGGELTNEDMQVLKADATLLLLLLLLVPFPVLIEFELIKGLVIKEQLLLEVELSPIESPLLVEVPTTRLLVLIVGGWI